MKTKSASPLRAVVPGLRRRLLPALLIPLAAALLAPLGLTAQTSAVPNLISYQGRVSNSAGVFVGAGTPVNRTVTFRIWSSSTGTAAADLIYSEQQTVTISEGEFSVLIGQGTAVSTESTKGPPAVTIGMVGVFSGPVRYLGVTVDDGTSAVDTEISPRQQMVSSAYSMRAKYAEFVGANGANSLTALDNGNIGIGTTNPGVRLDVAGSARAGGVANASIALTNASNVNVGVLGAPAGSGAFSNDAAANDMVVRAETGKLVLQSGAGSGGIVVNASNNVGIGTNNPGVKLDVFGATRITTDSNGALKIAGSGNNTNPAELVFDKTVAGATHGAAVGYATDRGAFWWVNGSDRLNITTAGNVGIGDTSPATKLDVAGGIRADGGTSSGYTFSGVGDTDGGLFSPADGVVTIRTNAAERVRVDSSGNVGIGNTGPIAPLSFANGIGQKISFFSASGTASYGMGVQSNVLQLHTELSSNDIAFGFGSSAALTETMRIKGTGNVGIGTNAPTAKLHVNGGAIVNGTLGVDGANVLELGVGVTKEASAGKIGYRSFSNTAGAEALDIVGAGTTGNPRFVRIWDRLGIGTSSPIAPLQVSGGTALGAFFLGAKVWPDTTGDDNNSSFNPSTTAWGGTTHSIVSDLRIRASALDITNIQNTSDARIKRIVGRSSGARDLGTLMNIEVTDYTFIDTAINGSTPQKKVIAQQIEKVFPQAASRAPGVVPDIYKKADIRDGWIALATDLKVGDRVRLIGNSDSGVHEVLEVGTDRFRTAFKPEGDKVFVYGREVKDFGSVDYTAISMLNVSATQELKRENDALRAANAALEARLAAVEAQDRTRDAKLAAIEKLLAASATVMAAPAKPAAASEQQ